MGVDMDDKRPKFDEMEEPMLIEHPTTPKRESLPPPPSLEDAAFVPPPSRAPNLSN
jgi:hypothetical protein